MKLTDRKIRALDPGEYPDDDVTGLVLRVSADTGKKTFTIRYRVGRVRRRVSLGTYGVLTLAEARKRARVLLGTVAGGADPAAERDESRRAPTVDRLLDFYLESILYLQRAEDGRWVPTPRARPGRKTWRETARIVEKEIRPALGKWRVGDVRRGDVLAIREAIVRRGAPTMANRTVSLISRLFALAIELGYPVASNPASGLGGRRSRLPERDRTRVLSDVEVVEFWGWTATLGPLPRAYARLLLLCGQRATETVSMEWKHVEGGTWTIPAARTKNGREHAVPLSEPALRELEAVRDLSEGGWVFPSPAGGHLRRRHLNKLLYRHRARLSAAGVEPPDWTIHDVRRTVATGMATLSVFPFVVAKVLNHSVRDVPDVTGRYDRYDYSSELRRALVLWGDRVERLVTGRDVDAKIAGRIGA